MRCGLHKLSFLTEILTGVSQGHILCVIDEQLLLELLCFRFAGLLRTSGTSLIVLGCVASRVYHVVGLPREHFEPPLPQ